MVIIFYADYRILQLDASRKVDDNKTDEAVPMAGLLMRTELSVFCERIRGNGWPAYLLEDSHSPIMYILHIMRSGFNSCARTYSQAVKVGLRSLFQLNLARPARLKNQRSIFY